MSLYDLRLHQDYNRLNVYISKISNGKEVKQGKVWQHIRKNGEKVSMQTRFYVLKYNDIDAILIMANNITEKIQLLRKLAHERHIRQQEIAKAVLTAQEKERSDIGKELHDNVNQILATSRLFIDVALRNNQIRKALLEKSSLYIMNAIDEIRKIAHELVGPSFEYLSLEESIGRLVEDFRLGNDIGINVFLDNLNEVELNAKFKLNLFRIIQEQLNNIVKHAKATLVNVILESKGGDIRLLISDNGEGFDVTGLRNGIGIANMKNRAQLYCGKLKITSSPGQGCSLELIFPSGEK
jgi:signal transduction histidine kinase